MSTESPRHILFTEFAAVAQALGNPHRLDLLEHLAQGERSVDALANKTRLSVANASQHLKLLRRTGLVSTRRDGKFVICRLADDSVLALLAALRRVAERNVAEVGRLIQAYFDGRDKLEPVSRDELLDRSRSGLVTILDVRPADEFALGHLPGAVNIAPGELETRLSELDPTQDIVAYCRGPYCILAYDAVIALRERGFRARRLEDGFPQWKAAGLPVQF